MHNYINNVWKILSKLFKIKSLKKQPACFKNPENPSRIDLILTNSPYNFQTSVL